MKAIENYIKNIIFKPDFSPKFFAMKNIQIIAWTAITILAYLIVFYGDDYLGMSYALTLVFAIYAFFRMLYFYLKNHYLPFKKRIVFMGIIGSVWLLFWCQYFKVEHFAKLNALIWSVITSIAMVFIWYLIASGLKYITRSLR